MNTSPAVSPHASAADIVPAEVRLFLAAVRRLLADLPAEEAREMTDGLEADLADLVAERGPQALGDAEEYARELRAAAGLAPVAPAPNRGRGVGEHVNGFLDAMHARWDDAVSGLPGTPWEFLVSLRPAWWILRAWVALQLVDLLWGSGSYNYGLSLVPSLGGGLDVPLLLVAIVLSVALGRGLLWPTLRTTLGRVALLGLNGLAIVIAPYAAGSLVDIDTVKAFDGNGDGYQVGYRAAIEEGKARTDKAGMYVDGRWITNIFPYDAKGRPLVGVQLLDQTGKPVTIGVQANYREQAEDKVAGPFVPYAWSDGRTEVYNVFPLAERLQADERPERGAFEDANPPRIGPFPVARAARVSLPGVDPTVARHTAKGTARDAVKGTASGRR